MFGKKHGAKQNSWGLGITLNELFRTAILALSIFAIYYLILYVTYALFHIDYRFWFMGVRVFQPEMLLVLAMYFPFFFVFFFIHHRFYSHARQTCQTIFWWPLLYYPNPTAERFSNIQYPLSIDISRIVI